MGHANIWNSHPKTTVPDPVFAVSVGTLMGSSGSMVSCVAGSASTPMQKKSVSSSIVESVKPAEDGAVMH